MNSVAAKPRAKVFILDVAAPWTRKRTDLSKAARELYLTMLGLANRRTNELAIRGNPLDWKFIARKAEIGRDKWQRCRKELIAAGLLSIEREHVEIFQNGRKRIVWGRVHYWVHRQPQTSKTVKKPYIFPMPDFSAAEESGTQSSSNTPRGGNPASDGFSVPVLSPEGYGKSNHPEGDDCFFPLTLMAEAEEILRKERQEWEPWQVQAAIWTVAVNAVNSNKIPRSANYFVAGVRALDSSNLYLITNCWKEHSFRAWLTHTQENMRRFSGSTEP